MSEIIAAEEVNVEEQSSQQTKHRGKLYSVIAYISIFWLAGFFASPEKHKKDVRFHVGQGIALCIARTVVRFVLGGGGGLLGMLIAKLTGISFADGFQMGWDSYLFPMIYAGVLLILIFAFEVFFFVMTIKGMTNAAKGLNEPIKMIGKFAFYK